jgi:hypothetical protein
MRYISLECKYFSAVAHRLSPNYYQPLHKRAPFCVTYQRQAMDVK